MTRVVVGIILLTVATVKAQPPPRWAGSWRLDVTAIDRTAIAAFGPVPTTQRLTIRRTDTTLVVTGETTVEGSSRVVRDDTQLSLHGTATERGPITLSVTVVDDSSFEIVSRAANLTQLSRFVVETDGDTLTETKTRGGRSVVLVFRRTTD